MAKDAKTRGLEVLVDLFPDPTVRAARESELGEAGLITLGNSVLRQDDYSRARDEVSKVKTEAEQLYESNQAWYTTNVARLAELDQTKAELEALKAGKPTPDPTKPAAGLLTEEQFTKRIAETEDGAVAFFADLNQLSMQHFQQFGEILDTRSLLADRRVQQIGIHGVYQDKFAPQIKAKADAAEATRIEAIRVEERTKIRAEFANSQHPYPIRGNDPSTLDGIQPPGTPPVLKSVDDMAAEYARLGASRAS